MPMDINIQLSDDDLQFFVKGMRDVVGGWRAFRRLGEFRWMVEHGFDIAADVAALDQPA